MQRRLGAKIFVGATMWHGYENAYSVGERNASFAHRFLAEQNIPILGADVGGNFVRKVIFDSNSSAAAA